MIDYVAVIRTESARFSECLRSGDLEAAVPSCPGWDLADLAWHLIGVQDFWGSVAGELLLDPSGVDEGPRPDDSELPAMFDDRAQRLVAALELHPPDARCWSWYDEGWNIGWVRRRQAHEALIHRVDAELVTGHRTPIDAELAADGIDELLFTMVDGVPEWATFIPDETNATLTVDGGPTYGFRFGRIVGTGPESGKDYDFDTLLISEPAGTVISGSAPDLDVWLWGRGGSGVRCDDSALLDRVRAIVTDATQ